MTINRKWVCGVGVLACLGVFWGMRSAASWRPVVVLRLATLPKPVRFLPGELRCSGDGRFLLLNNGLVNEGVILNVKTGAIDTNRARFLGFNASHGLKDFPRVWFDINTWRLYFSPSRGRALWLPGIRTPAAIRDFPEASAGFEPAWSQTRGEVYGALNGVLWIWDWNTGKIKKQVRFSRLPGQRTVFSPDGKWFLVEEIQRKTRLLRRYEVQNVKKMVVVGRSAAFRSFGFSPDSQLMWFSDRMTRGNTNFYVQRAASGALAWWGIASGPVKWLPDGRVGIVGEGGFEWRRASGQLLRRLPGPFDNHGGGPNHIQDWTPSPDGNWIYSCDQTAVIRRWRAR